MSKWESVSSFFSGYHSRWAAKCQIVRTLDAPLALFSKLGYTIGTEKYQGGIIMSVMHITKANYDELVKNSDKPVLLDFWAPWCGPCRMVGPIVEEIAQEREDIAVGKINVDEEVELAMEFGIASIPTLVVVEHGEVMNKAIGYMPKAEIESLLG